MFEDSVSFSKSIRKEIIKMVHGAKASHVGGALSMADLLAVLYFGHLNIDPADSNNVNRDRFFLSKGHACTALYATLALRDFFPMHELANYAKDGSMLLSHTSHKVPGIEVSAGSLGHALPVACGVALALKQLNLPSHVYCMLSDGELDEGSNWESILFAPHHKLNNLSIIIDYNKIQSFGSVEEVLNLEPLHSKLAAFNWNVLEINGHDHLQIHQALKTSKDSSLPTAIIAHTIKGKGVDFMENDLLWHYRPPSDDQLQEAIRQIEK